MTWRYDEWTTVPIVQIFNFNYIPLFVQETARNFPAITRKADTNGRAELYVTAGQGLLVVELD